MWQHLHHLFLWLYCTSVLIKHVLYVKACVWNCKIVPAFDMVPISHVLKSWCHSWTCCQKSAHKTSIFSLYLDLLSFHYQCFHMASAKQMRGLLQLLKLIKASEFDYWRNTGIKVAWCPLSFWSCSHGTAVVEANHLQTAKGITSS